MSGWVGGWVGEWVGEWVSESCTQCIESYSKVCLILLSGRELCLEYRVSWIRVPPEAAHFS